MREITTKAELEELIGTAGKVVVVKYGAQWCGPCRMILPHFTRLEDELGEKVLFAKVDVDEADELAEEAEIECMPTFFIYKNGAMVNKMMGANKDAIFEFIRSLV